MNLNFSLIKSTLRLTLPFCIGLLSCKSDSTEKLMQYQNKSILQSTKFTANNNYQIFDRLLIKKTDFRTARHAAEWEPKAERIRGLSKQLVKEIDSVREAGLLTDKEKIKQLYSHISKYRTECFSVDQRFAESLERDSIPSEKEFIDWMQAKPDLTLNITENKIVNLENLVLTFCDNVSTLISDDYREFSFIVNQNTKYLKPGETLEINGGIGSFSFAARPAFMIAGKKWEIGDDAMIHYTLIADNKPGKHVLPITISYTRPDGEIGSLTNNLEYYVDP